MAVFACVFGSSAPCLSFGCMTEAKSHCSELGCARSLRWPGAFPPHETSHLGTKQRPCEQAPFAGRETRENINCSV